MYIMHIHIYTHTQTYRNFNFHDKLRRGVPSQKFIASFTREKFGNFCSNYLLPRLTACRVRRIGFALFFFRLLSDGENLCVGLVGRSGWLLSLFCQTGFINRFYYTLINERVNGMKLSSNLPGATFT